MTIVNKMNTTTEPTKPECEMCNGSDIRFLARSMLYTQIFECFECGSLYRFVGHELIIVR